MKILLTCLSLLLACVSNKSQVSDDSHKTTLRITEDMKLNLCMELLETFGAKNWTAGNSLSIGQEITDKPQYSYTYQNYDLPNGMLLTLWGKSIHKVIGNDDLNRDQYILTSLSISNSRILRSKKQAKDYPISEIWQTKNLDTKLVSLNKTESFVYKGMLKSQALALLEPFEKVKYKSNDLKKYIELIEKERKLPYFPAPNVISKNDKWEMYNLKNGYKLFIQYNKKGNSETIATLLSIFPVNETYGNISPTFKKKNKDFAILEYELINIKKPATGREEERF